MIRTGPPGRRQFWTRLTISLLISADILSYKRRTGQELDFVLLLSYRDEFKDHEYTKEIFAQLEQGYDRAFVSEFGHAMLYKRRGL